MPQELKTRLVVIQGEDAGHIFEIQESETTIGRAADAQISLNSSEVSRYHARISRREDSYFLEDNNSANGTTVNGERLSEPRLLQDKDLITLGENVILEFQILPFIEKPRETIVLRDLDVEIDQTAPSMQKPVIEASAVGYQAAATRAYTDSGAGGFADGGTSPRLIVTIAGQNPVTYSLSAPQILIGREEDNEIVIPSKIISRHHASLEQSIGGYRLVLSSDNTNETYVNGELVRGAIDLPGTSVIRVGSAEAGELVTMQYQQSYQSEVSLARNIQLGKQTKLLIGRDPNNDIVLDAPPVSRFHAEIEHVGQRYRVKDLQSVNKTFVNDQPVMGEIWAKPQDRVRIGPYLFVLGEEELAQIDQTGGMRVDAVGLQKWVRKDLNLLQNISLVLKPREFLVVVGQSGGGKTTLVDALAGYRPATHGHVYVNDTDIYRHFDAVRSSIGYVPQRDIIHMELTVFESLNYAAQLRMPPDTSSEERHRRIAEVMEDLDLTHRRDVQISGLSGGQQKRVSIGVELLTKPGLFFLDEPTSGLDPGTETSLMQLMRRLADQGRTIILITHATKNVMLADKVIFLARGGYLAWFGPPDEALSYFAQFQSDRERRYSGMDFDQIYAILEDPSKGSPKEWQQRYLQHSAYQKYVLDPLRIKGMTPELPQQAARGNRDQNRSAPSAKRSSIAFNPIRSIRQFVILSKRNLKILSRDRISLILMLAAAPLVGMLDFILANGMGRNSFDYVIGDFPPLAISLFLFAIYGVLVGGLSQMREIVKERAVYRRERLVNLQILPYTLSKMWVAALLALYHALAYTTLHYLAFDMPGGALGFGLIYISVALATFAGMMMGLFASSLAPNSNTAPMIVILIMLPQIVLGGALIPLPSGVTAITSTRWAFQSFIGITGLGSDLAADACWDMPEAQRQNMTLAEKENLGCLCLGTNTLRRKSCEFPGLGGYYNEAIDAPQPIGPSPIGEPPEKPQIPEAPPEPTDPNDLVAMNAYLQALKEHQASVAAIQSEYEANVEAYQTQVKQYQESQLKYQQDLADWEIKRTEAVGQAEGVLGRFHRLFGWATTDQKDAAEFTGMLIRTWLAQLTIISVLFILIVIMMKTKDRAK